MESMTEYLDSIVQPTFDDYTRSPSTRRAYLACLVAYHAIQSPCGDNWPLRLSNKFEDVHRNPPHALTIVRQQYATIHPYQLARSVYFGRARKASRVLSQIGALFVREQK